VSAPLPKIHLVNPLWNAAGGSEWRTLELHRLLRDHAAVWLWAAGDPDPRLAALYPIQRINVARGYYPRAGTLVFIGDYHQPTDWIARTDPHRTLLVYNTNSPARLSAMLDCISMQGRRSVELVYSSTLLQQLTGLPGRVERSLIDLNRFVPGPMREQAFTVGRLSRDVPEKHHPDDPGFYRHLGGEGTRIRVMGGTCLEPALREDNHVELLPACAEPAEHFLSGLDCFFYRTHPQWLETWGRVVSEAMACGLPVVCERRGGYTEIIEHGRDGFLFDDEAGALDAILSLKKNPWLRRRIGRAARERIQQVHGPQACAQTAEFYLR